MKKLILLLVTACYLTNGFSQQNLPVDVIQVVKDFDARLDEAERIKVNPIIPSADTSSLRYRYDVNPGIQELKYGAPQIRPLAIKPAEPIPNYPFYLKAGYGIPNQAYGRLSYSFKNDDRTKIGIDLNHLSANNKKNTAQRFYDNDLKGHVFYLTEEGLAIQGDAQVSKDRYHHFGHFIQDPASTTPTSTVKHDYDLIEIGAKLFNPKISAIGVNYYAALNLSSFIDNYSSNEKSANLQLGLTKWIKERHSIGIELGTDFTSLEDSTNTQNLNNFYVLPSVGIHGTSFSIKGGVRVTSHNDNLGLFPVVHLSARISGNQLMVIAGADGGLNKNNYRTLSAYNPFITYKPTIKNTEQTQFYAGIKGSAKTLEYDARVGYKINKNLPLFILETKALSRFDILYRDLDVIHSTASLTFRPTKFIVVNGAINKNFFRKNIEPQAWGLPSLELNGSVQYQSLNKKLLLTAETYINDGIPYKDDLNNSGTSKLLLDISLGADYHITKNFGLFVQANNLANSYWRRWYQYPTYGINAVGGITVKF